MFIIKKKKTYINLRERLSYLQSNPSSSQFVTSFPDVLDIMSDDVLLEGFHQYLGQPSPEMQPFLHKPHYIGSQSRHQTVDKYGISVARAQLGGGDFNHAHGALELIMKGILKKAGMFISIQPSHMFHGKVPGPAIEQQ